MCRKLLQSLSGIKSSVESFFGVVSVQVSRCEWHKQCCHDMFMLIVLLWEYRFAF